ncbi:Putative negative regulator of RcsB-dependent stress response [Noviherbaspirillum humi]|uniref:Putative negative regulator of RcsB-dependent stress response n=1 Tax=Noviherbaspirillum humi TaxID=1688639 RepID=A0A239FR35_9BURK|nr:tetratricopeptide repeat protein [Noviherbaspirillum humi]SNS59300.1 Putative negative regulator of RcsB-dependent stress response [Noviherbaspirillum humi]
MAYDHEEQEQLASLKAWWNQYGNLVTWVLIAALAAYAGWTGWKAYERNQTSQAALLYEELEKAAAAKDLPKVQRAAADLGDRFGRTAYAQMGGLVAAKAAVDANDLKLAKAQLQQVADKGRDEEYRAVAKLRLAGILLDEKAYDDGLKLLGGSFPAQFAGAVADRKGDLLMAQNKTDEARAAYQQALEKTDQKNPGRQLIQLKLDALGGAKSVG